MTLQGSGFFNKQTTDRGITNEPTNSGGVMAGYRFNLKNWLSVEGDYDYFRNSQKFWSGSGATSIPMNVHAATAFMLAVPVIKGGIRPKQLLVSTVCTGSSWQNNCKDDYIASDLRLLTKVKEASCYVSKRKN